MFQHFVTNVKCVDEANLENEKQAGMTAVHF